LVSDVGGCSNVLEHVDETGPVVGEGETQGLEVRFDRIHRLNQVLQSTKPSIERGSTVFDLRHINRPQQP
jgi:hypothetical protein